MIDRADVPQEAERRGAPSTPEADRPRGRVLRRRELIPRRLQHALRRFTRNGGAVVGVLLLLGWILVAIFAEEVAPYDPLQTVSGSREPPSAEFWFGTDKLGRDVLSRVIVGSRISLMLGIISVVIGAVAGTVLGLLAGYYAGVVDAVIMRMMDALLAFPGILLALVVIAALGPSIQNVMLAVGVASIPQYARLVRGSVLAIKETSYIEAAHVIGAGSARVIFVHILPNASASLIVLSTLQVGAAILIGAGLSFLGLGAQPPTPEWGLMSAEGREVLGKAWWISTFPGLAILSVVMAANLMGDGLRAALDPRMRLD